MEKVKYLKRSMGNSQKDVPKNLKNIVVMQRISYQFLRYKSGLLLVNDKMFNHRGSKREVILSGIKWKWNGMETLSHYPHPRRKWSDYL